MTIIIIIIIVIITIIIIISSSSSGSSKKLTIINTNIIIVIVVMISIIEALGSAREHEGPDVGSAMQLPLHRGHVVVEASNNMLYI